MVENQSAYGLNRGLLWNVWWLRSANSMKFTEECVMCTEKYVLFKKMFTNGLHVDLPLQAWIKKTVHGGKACWLSSKEKVLGAAVSIEGHANSLLTHKRTYLY